MTPAGRAGERTRIGQREGWVAAAMAMLIGLGLLVEGFDDLFGGDVICIGFGVAVLMLLILRAPSLAFWRASGPVLLLLAAGLGWAAACSVPAYGGEPVAPDLLAPELARNGGLIAALLAGALLGARRVPLGRFVHPFLMVGLAGLALGLLVHAGLGAGEWTVWTQRNEGRFLGTLGNAEVAAAVYGSLAVLALAAALEGRARGSRPHGWVVSWWLLATMLAFGAELLTASRTGTLLTVVALLFVGSASRRRIGAWTVAGVSVLFGIGMVASAGLLVKRFYRIGEDLGMRPLMWRHYSAIAREAPWRGHGLGAFPTLNVRHLDTVPLGEALWMVNAPHDIWLGLVLQGGLPWFALSAAAVLWMALRIVRRLRRRRPSPLESGAIGVVVIVLGLASVDIAFEVPATAALALLSAGWLWGGTMPRDYVRVARARRIPFEEEGSIAG